MNRQFLRLFQLTILALISFTTALAQSTAPDAAELTKLLNDFLGGASRNDPEMHDRFWADDLIYTRSAGRRTDKAEIMRGVRSAPAPKANDPQTIYTAEDIRIQQYGTTSIVAFRLVATTETQNKRQVAHLLNTGTFLKRNGKWQAVAWQSTRMAQPIDTAKSEVTQVHHEFFNALLNGDVKAMESLTAESFVWINRAGQQSRKQLLDLLSSKRMPQSNLVITTKVRVSVTGETAVAQGTTQGERVAEAGAGTSEASKTAAYTLVFSNQGGAWLVVAMHIDWDD